MKDLIGQLREWSQNGRGLTIPTLGSVSFHNYTPTPLWFSAPIAVAVGFAGSIIGKRIVQKTYKQGPPDSDYLGTYQGWMTGTVAGHIIATKLWQSGRALSSCRRDAKAPTQASTLQFNNAAYLASQFLLQQLALIFTSASLGPALAMVVYDESDKGVDIFDRYRSFKCLAIIMMAAQSGLFIFSSASHLTATATLRPPPTHDDNFPKCESFLHLTLHRSGYKRNGKAFLAYASMTLLIAGLTAAFFGFPKGRDYITKEYLQGGAFAELYGGYPEMVAIFGAILQVSALLYTAYANVSDYKQLTEPKKDNANVISQPLLTDESLNTSLEEGEFNDELHRKSSNNITVTKKHTPLKSLLLNSGAMIANVGLVLTASGILSSIVEKDVWDNLFAYFHKNPDPHELSYYENDFVNIAVVGTILLMVANTFFAQNNSSRVDVAGSLFDGPPPPPPPSFNLSDTGHSADEEAAKGFDR
jgi:hypothetical protein